jgi:hypothetical protein
MSEQLNSLKKNKRKKKDMKVKTIPSPENASGCTRFERFSRTPCGRCPSQIAHPGDPVAPNNRRTAAASTTFR